MKSEDYLDAWTLDRWNWLDFSLGRSVIRPSVALPRRCLSLPNAEALPDCRVRTPESGDGCPSARCRPPPRRRLTSVA
jgi:hypothetical protein